MASLSELEEMFTISALEQAELLCEENREIHILTNAFDMSDKKFIRIFRLSKDMVEELIHRLSPHMTEASRISALSIRTKARSDIYKN